ncbi:hypothetical protein ACTVZO_40660 [Streptomyces sp. IBSNAI002]|uniref:hypothetical protein n=1 Tax=Streptomyces sp. IBSNAI002 TaxID=3457500 RepID=UPI003FD22748
MAEVVAVDFGAAQLNAVNSTEEIPFRVLGASFVPYALAYLDRFKFLHGMVFGADRRPALEEGGVGCRAKGERGGELRSDLQGFPLC